MATKARNASTDHAGRRAAVAVAGLGGLIAGRFLLPAGTPPIRTGRANGTRSVATLEKLRLGGSDQWVLERSHDCRNPILLYLHGGPGTSQLTSNRRDTRELERHFTVVNWDQRGAGKSYRAIRDVDKMNVDQFVEDTRQLTVYLLRKFGHDRLVLVGHSWGSVVGVLAVARYPELYSCYVGIGQIGNAADGEAASYRWTLDQAKAHNDQTAIRVLERIGPPPYQGDWRKATLTERRYLTRFGGEMHATRFGALPLVLGGLLFSREYTLADRCNYFRGILGSMRLLWPQLLEVDLVTSTPELQVPVFFMVGRHDHEVPSAGSERYFRALRAPAKELIWFENSAHLPNSEERDRFNRAMIETVLPVAAGRDAR